MEIYFITLYVISIFIVFVCMYVYDLKRASAINNYFDHEDGRAPVLWLCSIVWPLVMTFALVVSVFLFINKTFVLLSEWVAKKF